MKRQSARFYKLHTSFTAHSFTNFERGNKGERAVWTHHEPLFYFTLIKIKITVVENGKFHLLLWRHSRLLDKWPDSLTARAIVAFYRSPRTNLKIKTNLNKAGYTATKVACGWAGAIFEQI